MGLKLREEAKEMFKFMDEQENASNEAFTETIIKNNGDIAEYEVEIYFKNRKGITDFRKFFIYSLLKQRKKLNKNKP